MSIIIGSVRCAMRTLPVSILQSAQADFVCIDAVSTAESKQIELHDGGWSIYPIDSPTNLGTIPHR